MASTATHLLFYVLLILGIPFAALLRVYIKFRAFFNNPQFWLFGSYVERQNIMCFLLIISVIYNNR